LGRAKLRKSPSLPRVPKLFPQGSKAEFPLKDEQPFESFWEGYPLVQAWREGGNCEKMAQQIPRPKRANNLIASLHKGYRRFSLLEILAVGIKAPGLLAKSFWGPKREVGLLWGHESL